jgi:hypothetical protein
MTDLDALRRRVERFHHYEDMFLVRDLWAAVQEWRDLCLDAHNMHYEPVTADMLAIASGLNDVAVNNVFAVLGPLYRQRKT